MTNADNEKSSFNLQDGFYILFLLGITAIFIKVIYPFLIAVFLALIFANFFKRMFVFLTGKIHWQKNIAAISTVGSALIIIAVPLVLLSIRLTNETSEGITNFRENWPVIYKDINNSRTMQTLRSSGLLKNYEYVLDEDNLYTQVGIWVNKITEFFLPMVRSAFVNMSSLGIKLIFIMYIMFFLLRDGDRIINKIIELLPLDNKDGLNFLNEIHNVTNATILGTFVISIMEGALGGILFLIFGIPSPVFWAVIMSVLSMLPLVGTNTVLVPVGVYFLMSGRVFSGIAILVIGTGSVVISQYIIKPKLVGKQSGIHPVIIVLSTIGGISWLGLKGFLIGPMTAALCLALWTQFAEKYKNNLFKWNNRRSS